MEQEYERVLFGGCYWWRPVREDDSEVTLAVVDAGQLRVVRGGKYEKWPRADDEVSPSSTAVV